MAKRRKRRKTLIFGSVVGLPVAFLGLLFLESQLAAGGPKLPEEVYALDGRVEPLVLDGTAPPHPLRIAWMGDSTAAGVGASSAEHALPRLVAKGLGRPVELRSFAISGARVDDVLEKQLPLLLAIPTEDFPEFVVIDVGANDVTHLTNVNGFRSSYLGILDKIPESASVIVLGVPDLGSVTRLAQPLRFVAGVRGGTYDAVVEAMRDQGADYVNIADFTGPKFRADPDQYLAGDNYHASDAGYQLWADTVIPVIRWRLFKREHPNEPEPLQPKEAKGTVKGNAP